MIDRRALLESTAGAAVSVGILATMPALAKALPDLSHTPSRSGMQVVRFAPSRKGITMAEVARIEAGTRRAGGLTSFWMNYVTHDGHTIPVLGTPCGPDVSLRVAERGSCNGWFIANHYWWQDDPLWHLRVWPMSGQYELSDDDWAAVNWCLNADLEILHSEARPDRQIAGRPVRSGRG